MESGLEDRNNVPVNGTLAITADQVSMESGLEDRNNLARCAYHHHQGGGVSMESGLEDRNNAKIVMDFFRGSKSLNGVRPRRPEQCASDTI